MYGSLCRNKNNVCTIMMNRTVYALTEGLFWCLFPLIASQLTPIWHSCECINSLPLKYIHTFIHTSTSIYQCDDIQELQSFYGAWYWLLNTFLMTAFCSVTTGLEKSLQFRSVSRSWKTIEFHKNFLKSVKLKKKKIAEKSLNFGSATYETNHWVLK